MSKGVRLSIWKYACTKQFVKATSIAKVFKMDVFYASAALRELHRQGCFTRTWKTKGLARWYSYVAVKDCPPPGEGNYVHKTKTATVRVKVSNTFRYAKIENMPVVQL